MLFYISRKLTKMSSNNYRKPTFAPIFGKNRAPRTALFAHPNNDTICTQDNISLQRSSAGTGQQKNITGKEHTCTDSCCNLSENTSL